MPREAVATGARCLWLQLGVVNWEAARIAAEGGLTVVMDRCTAIEARRPECACRLGALGPRRTARAASPGRPSIDEGHLDADRRGWPVERPRHVSPPLGDQSRSSSASRHADGDRVVVAEDDPATGRQERVERVLARASAPRRYSTLEVGQTSKVIPWSAAQASTAGSSPTCDPCPIRRTPEHGRRPPAELAGPGLGRMGGQAEPGRGRDPERLDDTARASG